MNGRPRRTFSLALAVVAAVLTLAVAGCGGGSEDSDVDGPGDSDLYELVIPAGTTDRLRRGETVAVMPDRLEFRVGQTLLIRNDDSHSQSVGPYNVPAGETLGVTYGTPGRFEGECPLSEGGGYEIVVTE